MPNCMLAPSGQGAALVGPGKTRELATETCERKDIRLKLPGNSRLGKRKKKWQEKACFVPPHWSYVFCFSERGLLAADGRKY